MPDGARLRMMLSTADMQAAMAQGPAVCHELGWGSRLACLLVALDDADAAAVRPLLDAAWRRTARPADRSAQPAIPS
jgi:hypothetical protein